MSREEERELAQRRALELGYAFADVDRIAIDEPTLGSVPRSLVL